MAVGKSKTASRLKKKRQSKAKVNKASNPKHAQLDARFESQGARLAGAADMQKAPLKGGGSSAARRYFNDALKTKPGDRIVLLKKFPGKYRRLDKRQDELMSTASVRSLLGGILSKKLPANAQGNLAALLDEVSQIRLPTRVVGFALKGKRMQHPTNAKFAVFAHPYKTASEHAAYDVARRAAVADAIEAELNKVGGNATLAVYAGLRAAISYTLNEMASPPTAEDVKPYLWKPLTTAHAAEIIRYREKLKAVYVKLGGVQEPQPAGSTPGQRRSRKWRDSSRASPTSAVSPGR
jgi:hypothetical protein